MSRESDYKDIKELKRKMVAMDNAFTEVQNAHNAITQRERNIYNTSLSMPKEPIAPTVNHLDSEAFRLSHSGSEVKKHKSKIWIGIAVFSFLYVLLTVIGFELLPNKESSFGIKIINAFFHLFEAEDSVTLETKVIIFRIATYIGSLALVGYNFYLCKPWMQEEKPESLIHRIIDFLSDIIF